VSDDINVEQTEHLRKFWTLTLRLLLAGAMMWVVGCNNANVAISGTSSKSKTTTPSTNTTSGGSTTTKAGSPRVTISGGNFTMTAQVSGKQQVLLTGGNFTMMVEAVR
jgi:hypothetical protein